MGPEEDLIARMQAMRIPLPATDEAADEDPPFEPNLMVNTVARSNHQPATGETRPATGAVDVQSPELAPHSQPPRRSVQNNKENTGIYPEELAWGNASSVPVLTRRGLIPSEFSVHRSGHVPPPQVAHPSERHRQGHLDPQHRLQALIASRPEEDAEDRRRRELFEEALGAPIPSDDEEDEAERDERRQTLFEEALNARLPHHRPFFDDLESESDSPSSTDSSDVDSVFGY